MTLYRKIFDPERGPGYEAVSEEEEATIRATVVADGSSGPLLFNENGIECVHSDKEAAEIRTEWRAKAEAFAARVPAKVTPRQFRRALRQAGLRDAVEAAIANADEEMQDTWKYAVSIERAHPMLIEVATLLNVTSGQLDDLFRLAATL